MVFLNALLTSLNNVMLTYCVVAQSFSKLRVNKVTHLEVTGPDLSLDDAGSKLLEVVRMLRELALSQRYILDRFTGS